jgi:hypothetical protein
MDTVLVDLLSQYMTKMGGIVTDIKPMLGKMYQSIDRRDQEKVASISQHKDRAGALAQKMSSTRLLSGVPLIEGYDTIKQAALMLSDHDQALNVLDMVLDSIARDHTKQASAEPGHPCPAVKADADSLSANEWLVSEVLGPGAVT